MSARTREERLLAVYREAFEAQRSPFTDAGFTGSRDRAQHACVAAIVAALDEERQTDDAPAERPADMVNDSQWVDVHRHVSRCAVALGIVPGQYQTKGDTIRLVARVADAMASEPSALDQGCSECTDGTVFEHGGPYDCTLCADEPRPLRVTLGGAKKLEGFASGVGVDVEPPEAGPMAPDAPGLELHGKLWRREHRDGQSVARVSQGDVGLVWKYADQQGGCHILVQPDDGRWRGPVAHPSTIAPALPSGWAWEQPETETPFQYVGAFREDCASDNVRVYVGALREGHVRVTGFVPPSVVLAALRQFEAEDAEG